MSPQKLQQLETQIKTSGFTLTSAFHENEKGETTAQIINEKGEELLITFLPLSEGHEPQYKFQLLGSKQGGKNAGKTFTLQESELEKGLPLIQKNPNQALRLKGSGWNFAAPLAGIAGMAPDITGNVLAGALPEILPMPSAGTTKKLAKSLMARKLAEKEAQQEEQQTGEGQIIKTAGLEALGQIAKLRTLPEMLKKQPQKKVYAPQIPDKVCIKIPTGKVTETEKSVALDKLRGEIPVTESGQPQTGARADLQPQTRSQESQQPPFDFQQPQEEEIPLIPFAQKTKSKKGRLIKYIAGGAVATGIGIGGIGLFPIFFG